MHAVNPGIFKQGTGRRALKFGTGARPVLGQHAHDEAELCHITWSQWRQVGSKAGAYAHPFQGTNRAL